jgi:hypothetical protein
VHLRTNDIRLRFVRNDQLSIRSTSSGIDRAPIVVDFKRCGENACADRPRLVVLGVGHTGRKSLDRGA